MNATNQTVKLGNIKRQYARQPSFADLLPIEEWNNEEKACLLEDGLSVGALLELRDISSEAKPQSVIEELHARLTGLLSQVVPLEESNPWVIQFFVQDDPTLESLNKRLQDYLPKRLKNDPFSQHYLEVMSQHFKTLSRPKGICHDPLSDLPLRGKVRRIRLAVYRRYADKKALKKQQHPSAHEDPLTELNRIVDDLIARLQALGLRVRRLNGEHCYEWLVRWFNPKPDYVNGIVDNLLSCYPYCAPDHESEVEEDHGGAPLQGVSNSQNANAFSEAVLFSPPLSDETQWWFDGLAHRVMVFEGLKNLIDIGVVSRERAEGSDKDDKASKKYALLDKLPDGSIYTLQITFESRHAIEKHLQVIEKSAVGKGEEPQRIRSHVARALDEVRRGNQLFRVVQAIYYRAEDTYQLDRLEVTLRSLFKNAQLNPVSAQHEPSPIDTYLRFLPFNYNPVFDQKNLYRSTYQFASDVAALLPLYGRSRGDGLYPLHIFYNRGGEPFIFDHLNPNFKMANSHMMIVGSTGAGKSVTLNNLVMQLLAMKQARVFLIEAGGSFDLLADYISARGRSVKRLKFDRRYPVAINPFAEAYRALADIEREEAAFAEISKKNRKSDPSLARQNVLEKHVQHYTENIQKANQSANEDDKRCEDNRDILSEMALAVRTMVTGGLFKEEERFTLSDDMLIVETLVEAVRDCKEKGYTQVLTSHVIEYFKGASMKAIQPDVAKRLDEMARSMSGYIKGATQSAFFNRPSTPFEDCDFMQIELGFLQNSQYSSQLSLVMVSLLPKILAIAEANQHSPRPTVLILDECHILSKNRLILAFLVLMAKVARKLGLWLIPCTQNIEDFSGDEAKKILSMMETWLVLALDRHEIGKIEQFKPLSEEQKALILDIKKFPRIYSEGVLLGARYEGLFRNVPPRLALSLAMTEQDEKAKRREIMDEHHVNEVEAAVIMAKSLEDYTHKVNESEGFDD